MKKHLSFLLALALVTFASCNKPPQDPQHNTDVPMGAVDGLFSVNNTSQVYFSQGNLQYQASTETWRFAENQWDYIGADNRKISSSYTGWIDLFGWGTSGYDHGSNAYQPWSTSTMSSDYYAYGAPMNSLSSQTGTADWGYNGIFNGGDEENQWYTLSRDEWAFVFNKRDTGSGMRYAKAVLNGVNGVILLPDEWKSETYLLNHTDLSDVAFNSNVISASQWEEVLEPAGAVFLPAAGYRDGSAIGSVNAYGYYWSSSVSNDNLACLIGFDDAYLFLGSGSNRYFGRSVRLVHRNE